jgi:hypothetical protein
MGRAPAMTDFTSPRTEIALLASLAVSIVMVLHQPTAQDVTQMQLYKTTDLVNAIQASTSTQTELAVAATRLAQVALERSTATVPHVLVPMYN